MPPVETIGPPWRSWDFVVRDPRGQRETISSGQRGAGEVQVREPYGPLALILSGRDSTANGEVYSSESGTTYWVETEAPSGNINIPGERIGSATSLLQVQKYRKRAADATLKLVITEATLEAYDFNGPNSLGAHCPWVAAGDDPARCFDRVFGLLSMNVILERPTIVLDEQGNPMQGNALLWRRYHGGAQLQGWADNWHMDVYTHEEAHGISTLEGPAREIFRDTHFELTPVSSSSVGGQVGAIAKLREPVVVNVDLSEVPLDAQFNIVALVYTLADNRRGRESYISARLRDPVSTGGARVESTGLELIETSPWQEPAVIDFEQPSCTVASTLPQAGSVQFSAPSYLEPEFGNPGPTIFVTRTGGNAGTVIATVTTSDDTAVAGLHYTAVSRRIVFPDGDSLPRAIRVPVLENDTAEGDRTVNLNLSAAAGCATLGAQSSAVLTIIDDEYRPLVNTYSVGGTVTGLEGAGLVLEEMRTGSRLTPSNGAFAFGYEFSDAESYDVRIITQPTNPSQACSLTEGSGVIAAADVTNVAVSCVTPPSNARLDPTFGSGGKVTAGLSTGRALALQSDGKIVAIGGLNLARFNADGSIDPTFGNAGTVPIDFEGTLLGDEANALAIQADDKIVVAGFTRFSGTDQRMAVARFNADGTVDAGFGNGGRTSFDPYRDVLDKNAGRSIAHKLLIQPDGKIVAVGSASFVGADGVPRGGTFAAVRLNADGTPDTQFAGDGASTIGGGVNTAYGVALQSDGKLVLAGRAGDNVNVNTGLARLKPDGTLDTEAELADRTPEHYGRDGAGVVEFGLAGWDEAADIVMLANNHIVVAVQRQVGLTFQFTLYRFNDDGDDLTATVVSTPIGPLSDYSRALVMQPDGKFVVVGQVSSSTVNDFGIVRYNADLTLDTSFGTGGILLVDFFGASDGANDVAIQPDGRIVAIGVARNGTSNGLGLVRILP